MNGSTQTCRTSTNTTTNTLTPPTPAPSTTTNGPTPVPDTQPTCHHLHKPGAHANANKSSDNGTPLAHPQWVWWTDTSHTTLAPSTTTNRPTPVPDTQPTRHHPHEPNTHTNANKSSDEHSTPLGHPQWVWWTQTQPRCRVPQQMGNTSAGYTTNMPSPARTQHPHEHEQIKWQTWHTTSTSPASTMNTDTTPAPSTATNRPTTSAGYTTSRPPPTWMWMQTSQVTNTPWAKHECTAPVPVQHQLVRQTTPVLPITMPVPMPKSTIRNGLIYY